MSCDVYFEIDTGGPTHAPIGDIDLNYTWNCGPMFRLALGGDGINDLDGKIAGDMIASLAAAVAHMSAPDNASVYEALNPPNKWGNHAGATRFLRDILANAEAHPKAIIRVC